MEQVSQHSRQDRTTVPTSPFKTILNFRDIGQSINDIQSANVLRQGLIFRGARPDNASLSDREALITDYRIRTIIDLRSKTEHIQQGKNNDAKIRNLAAGLEGSQEPFQPVKIPQLEYYKINLNGSSYERALLKRLKYWSLAKLIGLMAVGRRTDAIWILGNEVIQPRGLTGQAQDSLDHCGAEIRQVLEILVEAKHYPIYFHCTSGKDRTGLIALILLMILQIPPDAISADYTASEGQLASEESLRIKELKDMGLSADFAGCPLDWVTQVQEHISQTYGSLEDYLSSIGFGLDLQARIRRNMFITNDEA